MLSPSEQSGLKDILNYLETSDLYAMTNTITKKMITVLNRAEAIDAILSFTERPSSLLRRQKIKKEILLKYIWKNNISISPNAQKTEFIKTCLKFWNSSERFSEQSFEDTNPDEVEMVAVNNTEVVHSYESYVFPCIYEMGIQFSKWFFNGLNQLQEFGPEHFWPDCNLLIEIKSPNEIHHISASNSYDAVQVLMNLIRSAQFYFNPNNTQEGIKTQQEEHGLVKIIINGVVHQLSNCIGLFNALFGLVKNPESEDNWKIKCLQMRIDAYNYDKARLNLSYDPNNSLCQPL